MRKKHHLLIPTAAPDVSMHRSALKNLLVVAGAYLSVSTTRNAAVCLYLNLDQFKVISSATPRVNIWAIVFNAPRRARREPGLNLEFKYTWAGCSVNGISAVNSKEDSTTSLDRTSIRNYLGWKNWQLLRKCWLFLCKIIVKKHTFPQTYSLVMRNAILTSCVLISNHLPSP